MKVNYKIIEKIKPKVKTATNMITKKTKIVTDFIIKKDIMEWALVVLLIIDLINCIAKFEFHLNLQIHNVALLIQVIISLLLVSKIIMQNRYIRELEKAEEIDWKI